MRINDDKYNGAAFIAERELIKATVRAHSLTDLSTEQARFFLERCTPDRITRLMRQSDDEFARSIAHLIEAK